MVPELVQVSSFWSCSGKDHGLARGNLLDFGLKKYPQVVTGTF